MARPVFIYILLLIPFLCDAQQWLEVTAGQRRYYSLQSALRSKEDVHYLTMQGSAIRKDQLEQIGELTNLEYLSLENAALDSLPAAIFTLPALKILVLGKNNFDHIPEGIGQLKTLIRLIMSDNRISEIPGWMATLPRLQSIVLSGNRITTIHPDIGKLVNLEELSLRRNQLTTLPEDLEHLQALRELYLDKNQLTDLPFAITRLTNLEKLDISYNQVGKLPDDLGALKKLELLYAYGNRLTQLPTSAEGLHRLKKLELRSNPIGSTIETFRFPRQLQVVTLSGKDIRQVPAALQHCRQLQTLSITNTSIVKLPDWIGSFRALLWLILDNNQISILPDLNHLNNLIELSAANNKIRLTPEKLLRLPYLRTVNLSSNPIQHIPEHVVQALSLSRLDLYDTNISPEEWNAFSIPSNRRLVVLYNMPPISNEKKDLCYSAFTPEPGEAIFTKVEIAPSFMGIKREWINFFMKNMKDSLLIYLKDSPEPHDSVVVHFVVRREGGISNLQVTAGQYEPVKAEVVRLMKLSCPYWRPATQGGRSVIANFKQIFVFDVKGTGPEAELHVKLYESPQERTPVHMSIPTLSSPASGSLH